MTGTSPTPDDQAKLKSCYRKVLELALENDIQTLALCCISTGIYGYPKKSAAHAALKVVRQWLEDKKNADSIERIIFCMYLQEEMDLYSQIMPVYFPVYQMPVIDIDDD